jgi:hypothetical protein
LLDAAAQLEVKGLSRGIRVDRSARGNREAAAGAATEVAAAARANQFQ